MGFRTRGGLGRDLQSTIEGSTEGHERAHRTIKVFGTAREITARTHQTGESAEPGKYITVDK